MAPHHPSQVSMGYQAHLSPPSEPDPAQNSVTESKDGESAKKDKADGLLGSATQRIQGRVEKLKVDSSKVKNGFKDDLKDIHRNHLSKANLCTTCEALPIAACLPNSTNVTEECVHWKTSLARILYNADWCHLCKLLLSILCRPEHDPLKHPGVEPYLPDEMKGTSMAEWSGKGWTHTKTHWPFGVGKVRTEGATHQLGSAGEKLGDIAIQKSMEAMIEAVLPSRKAFKASPADGMLGVGIFGVGTYQQWQIQQARRYPKECTLGLRIMTRRSRDNGMVFATLRGFGNRPQGQMEDLSRFRLRIAHPDIQMRQATASDFWYGRVLDQSWIDVSIGKQWIQECEQRHGEACSHPSWGTTMPKLDFIRVIDVDRMRLVEPESPSSCRFVALSYKWGGVTSAMLVRDNIHALSQPGGVTNALGHIPRTIVDAMEVVKAMGERYLWVDSLCIQQDGGDEKKRQIAAMDRIYGHALLTIVAASGINAAAGLQGINRVHFPLSAGETQNRRSIFQPSVPMSASTQVISPFQDTQDLAASPWEARAWTYQEKMLSRRLLVFCGQEVTWHCRQMTCREDMRCEDWEHKARSLDWLMLKPQHFRPSVGLDPHWVDGSIARNKHGKTHVERSSTFSEYTKIVEAFTNRELTNPGDVIFALQGLLNILSLAFQSVFFYGLPEIIFDVALLWTPLQKLDRRSAREAEFPSWSWAGWEGLVGHESAMRVIRDKYGEATGAEVDGQGEEGIRPLIHWYCIDESGRGLRNLNAHGRGIPVPPSEIPREWEGSPSGVSESTGAGSEDDVLMDIYDIELQKHHLIFRTSCATSLKIDQTWSPTETPRVRERVTERVSAVDAPGPVYVAIRDPNNDRVGNLVLDTHEQSSQELDGSLLILLAESQPFHFNVRWEDTEEYSCYVVMLVKKMPGSKTYERLGIGRIWKTAWQLAGPSMRTIVLG